MITTKMKPPKLFQHLALACFLFAFEIITVVQSKAVVNGKDAGKVPNPTDERSVSINRAPRAEISLLKLRDPLDCLSQVVCGLNTYPPQKPSVRTNTANDFAYILRDSITKLRSQKPPTTTTTTPLPPTSRRTTTRVQLNDDDEEDDEDEDDSIENELDYDDEDGNETEDYYNDDEYNDPPHPPPIPIDRRRLKRSSRSSISLFFDTKLDSGQPPPPPPPPKKKHKKKKKKHKKKVIKNDNIINLYNKRKPEPFVYIEQNGPSTTMSPLDRLRIETDLRAKLLSEAQCANGLNDHSCPFNYQQMLSLISSSLERERTVSYTTNKVLPMVGYLIKSRNYTATLAATFTAMEKINNYTIEADKQGKPVDFSHILDEVMNRQTGDNGLRIVDTSNDSGSASVWEDDEFDHVLENPYVRRKPVSDSYKLAKKKQEQKTKEKVATAAAAVAASASTNDDQSTTSEEDTSEEGLIFDRPKPPPRGPSSDVPDNDSSSEEDDHHDKAIDSTNVKKKKFTLSEKEKLAPPPVFGHLRKSAEEE